MTGPASERPHTLTLENGLPPKPTFSDDEMTRRCTALRAEMAALDIRGRCFNVDALR